MATAAERAYLAGVIDGEGSIYATYRESDRSIGVRVNICNTDPRMIDWIAERWPGRRSVVDRTKYGQKPIHRWDADGSHALAIIAAARPHLVIKREQAALAFKIITTARNFGRGGVPRPLFKRRLAMVRELQALNKRGTGFRLLDELEVPA